MRKRSTEEQLKTKRKNENGFCFDQQNEQIAFRTEDRMRVLRYVDREKERYVEGGNSER